MIKARARIRLTFTGLLIAVMASVTLAQPPVPYVPPETLDERRRMSQTDIRFCVWSDSPLKDFEVRVATEIAHALLLEPVIHEIVRPAATNDADFWEVMFTSLTNDCEALMGYILVPEQLPAWMIASRPYYSMDTVLAVTDAESDALEDLPPGSFIGTLLSTVGDFQLINYLQTLPEDRRWRRLPFDSAERLVERLLDGTVAAALLPEGAIRTDQMPGSETLRLVPTTPLSIAPTLFSIGMRSSETSLRSIVDEAILALIEDGTIAEILSETSVPGEAGSAGR